MSETSARGRAVSIAGSCVASSSTSREILSLLLILTHPAADCGEGQTVGPKSAQSFVEARAPVIRMPAVVLKCENAEFIRKDAVINAVRKTRHRVTANISLNDPPDLGCSQNQRDRVLDRP